MKVATDGPLSIAAVTERARKASLKCTMTNNAPQRAATKAALKADPLVPKQLINRIGAAKKPIAKMVYLVHLQGACSKSPKLKKKIPCPNYNAPSRKKYAKTPFIVYHIYALAKGPLEYSDTWKFGISRQADQAKRRNEQLPKCNKYYAPGRIHQPCNSEIIWQGTGWFEARIVEASHAYSYAMQHGGHCPPGIPACI